MTTLILTTATNMTTTLKTFSLIITRPAWAGFKTAEEGRANTPFGVGGPRG
jgi:hypothetical protein